MSDTNSITSSLPKLPRSTIISSIYFYLVLFILIFTSIISGIILIGMSVVKTDPITQVPNSSIFGSSILSTDTIKDIDTFKRECKSDLSSSYSDTVYSSSTYGTYDKEPENARLQKEQQTKDSANKAIDACATSRLSQYSETKDKNESNNKKNDEINKQRFNGTTIVVLLSSLVAIVIHLASFRLIRRVLN